MSGRAVAAALLVAAVAVAAVAIGRWERGRHADEENRGIARVLAAVGPLGNRPAGFRMLKDFQCLVYGRGEQTFALELCVDEAGRIVEAIDRRDETEIWSLREDPERASVRVDRREFEEVVVSMCAACRAIFERARDPLGRAP